MCMKAPSKKAHALKRPASRSLREASQLPKKAKAEQAKTHRSQCPINLVLEAIGDSWSMLIVRDLMLRGHNGYQGFLRSEEKIATNILADRLLKLEQNGLISKSPDPSDGRKFIYALTERGADLAPILVEMSLFSIKYETFIDMPKEVVLDMQRNKQTFTTRLIRNSAPKTRKPAAKKAEIDPAEETLSLF